MKFSIEYTESIINKELIYLSNECSFYMGKIESDIEVEWVLNKISLPSSGGRIIHLSGFCGLEESMDSNICIPKFRKGVLKVEHNNESGFAYSIFEEEQPILLNKDSGWVCVGNPLESGNAVEFITNCVAVINDVGDLISLWLRPKSLPKLLNNNR